MLVIVAPGQGAQAPGFLSPWLELPGFEDRLRWLSAVADLDLVHCGTAADADTIRDTAVAQPLIVAAGILAFGALTAGERGARIGGVAGHSVGEITAIVEGAAASPLPYAERAALDASTPIVPGQQETTATISVTFALR